MLLAVAGCGTAGSESTSPPGSVDRLIIPGRRIGPVQRSAGEAELRAAVGNGAIRPDTVHLAEGFCANGSILYPGDVDSVVAIWEDSTRDQPAEVRITGSGPHWRTPGFECPDDIIGNFR